MRYFQIAEDDLAELERVLPDICWSNKAELTPTARVRWRRVQEILKNVRWHYGPPEQVERVEDE